MELRSAGTASPFYRPEHEAFRAVVRRFVGHEIEPFATGHEGPRRPPDGI